MKITIGKAGGENVGIDLEILLRTRLLIQANSGGGKSWLIRRLCEQAFGKLQILLVDPEGEFATLREKFGFVLVGQGGETPADLRSAGLVAEKLLELRASAVCDIFEAFRKNPGGRHAWVKAFLNALLDAPKKLWHPALVIVDEAHKFCPEGKAGESEASEAMIGLATAGRKRGFCAVFATQRLGKLRKDASAELLNRLVGPTFEDVDLERAADLLSVTRQDRQKFFAEMRVLEPGHFFALGRAIAKERLLLKVGGVETTHPEMGSAKYAAEAPPPPEKVKAMLPKLADLPKAAEEQARTVAEFKAEIRSLKGQLRSQAKTPVEVKVTDSRAIERVARDVHAQAQKHIAGRERIIKHLMSGIAQAATLLKKTAESSVIPKELNLEPMQIRKIPGGEFVPIRIGTKIHRKEPLSAKQPIRTSELAVPRPEAVSDGDVELTGPQRKILLALAQLRSIGKQQAPRAMVAGWAGYSPHGGAFSNPLGALRSAGLLSYPTPASVALTEEGHRAIGEHAAPDAEEIQERIKGVCTGPERKILSALLEQGAEEITRAELAERSGYVERGGAFMNPLGALRTKGFLEYPRPGWVKAAEWVWEA